MKIEGMFMLLLIGSLATVGLSTSQNDGRFVLQSISACNGKSMVIRCPSADETVLVDEVIDGVKRVEGEQCQYVSGDCYKASSLVCSVSQSCTATLVSTSPLQGCSKPADYRTVRYYCVPRQSPNKYDICSTTEITAQNGIIYSPGNPLYTQQNRTCITKISVPQGKSLNIYIYDIKLKERNSDELCDDSLRIIDGTRDYIYCGTEIKALKESICSNVIYLSYKAFDFNIPLKRGFSLYFETRDLGTGSSCSTVTPTPPPAEITTTPFVPTEPDRPIVASEYVKFQVCKGKTQTITAPRFTEVYIEEIAYRVQAVGNICLGPTQYDCIGPYPNDCNLRPTCTYSLADTTIVDCQSKVADSIAGVYRFIPIASTVKFSVCSTPTISGDASPNGVITSRSYPSYETGVSCVTKLTSSNVNKAFKVYLTDIRMESTSGCPLTFVELDDNKKFRSRFCGSISLTQDYSFTSCSNNVDITYKTTNNRDPDFRGFRMYYELIDYPSSCIDTTVGITSTRPSTTTPLNDDVVNQISTTNGDKCIFPFRYNSTTNFDTCVAEGANYWCSTTANYELDKRRGDCSKSPTDIISFDVCKSRSRTFSCPRGYLINLISTIGHQTSGNVCNPSASLCRHDSTASNQKVISGKNSYRFNGANLLFSCNNALADVTTVEYNCIPDSVPYLQTYNVCQNVEINADTIKNGFITSPNYPNNQNNLNCATFTIKTNGENRILNIYSIGASLHVPSANQQCSESYVEINGQKYCGNLLTEFVAQKCATTFKFNYYVGSKDYKGFKFYFEVKNVTNPLQCLEVTTPIVPISTTLTPPPIWAVLNTSSGALSLTSCESNPINSISCPENYIISIRSFFFGKSAQNKCFYDKADCVGTANTKLQCSGQRECTLPSYATLIEECHVYSTYLQVDYECIPTHVNPTRLECTGSEETVLSNNGVFRTPRHPSYDQNMNCSVKISTPFNTIIKVYLFDTFINNDCSRDRIVFTEKNVISPTTICGQYYADLVYESCDDYLYLNLVTSTATDSNFKGIAAYYETERKPANYECPKPTSTTTYHTTPESTKVTNTPPTYGGLSSPVERAIICADTRIEAPEDYIIIIRSSFYGVSNSSSPVCTYNPNDCFGPASSPISACAGDPYCTISFYDYNTVSECGNRKNSYIFVEYQFVPKKRAGNPIKEENTVPCQVADPIEISSTSSLLVQSPNHPVYPTSPYDCSKQVTVPRDYVIDVYLLKADFRGSNDKCNETTDYIRMNDGSNQDVYFCKFSGNYPRHVFRSSSNFVNIESKILSVDPPTTIYYGWLLYLQAAPKPVISTLFTNPVTRPTTTKPVVIGLASEEYEINMCTDDKKELICPKDYFIIVTEEFLVHSTTSCKYSQGDCREPTELVSDLCRGKQSCKINFIPTTMSTCNTQYANGLDFKYLCVPAQDMESIKVHSCDSENRIDKLRNGFVQSPGYPRLFDGIANCSIELVPPEKSEYRVYAIDFALRNISENFLHIETTHYGFGTTPQLLYKSSRPFRLIYNSPKVNSSSESNEKVRGYKVYFEAFAITDTPTSTSPPKTTTEEDDFDVSPSKLKSGGKRSMVLIIATFAVAVPLLLVVILLIFFVNRSGSGDGAMSRVQFSSRNNEGTMNEDIKSFANPISS